MRAAADGSLPRVPARQPTRAATIVRMKTIEPVPSEVYTEGYLLSEACEGYAAYQRGDVSMLKRRAVDLLGLAPGMRVLDLGCGRGEIVAELGRRDARAVGVDYAATAVNLTARSAPTCGVVRADAVALPFRDGSFDRVLFGDVIEHLPWRYAIVALQEVARVLSPDGFAVIHTAPNRWFVSLVLPFVRRIVAGGRPPTLAERVRVYDLWRSIVHPNELSPRSLRRLVAEAGLIGETWVDRDVLRLGSRSAWTSSLGRGRGVKLLARIGGAWPVRLVAGNDLYARVRSNGHISPPSD